jgi:serine/threonine protein phosphatase PrpC
MKFHIYQDTRIGGRRVNQDGMGGHPRGELAAHIAVESVLGEFGDWMRKDGRDAADMLRSAFGTAHRAIHRCAERERLWDLPRTTCAACVIHRGVALWSHVGDSRLYLVRAGKILATTRDHSGAWLLVEQGLITPEDARRHPDRNFVYNCLGGEVGPDIETSEPIAIAHGDRILLCSDGFWSPVRNEEIAAALADEAPEAALRALLGAAEARAGDHADNLSYVGLTVADDNVPGALDTDSLAPGQVVMRFPGEAVPAT